MRLVIIGLVLAAMLAPTSALAAGSRYRVKTFDGRSVNVYQGYLLQDEIRGLSGDGTKITIARDQVTRLQIRLGNRAKLLMTIGGIAGFATFAYIVFTWDNSRTSKLDGAKVMPLLFGTVGGGTALGLTIGLFIPRWRDIDVGNDWDHLTEVGPSVSVSMSF